MAVNDTIRGDRLHIAFFGRRNAGKSSLINALTGQEVAIVSDIPGTTTDPVYKNMELQPVGPVTIIDTAGIDDDARIIGAERVRRTRSILEKTDVAVIVADASAHEFSVEETVIEECVKNNRIVIIALNKCDINVSEESHTFVKDKIFQIVSAKTGEGVSSLKELIRENSPREWEAPFLADLVRPGDTVLLVAPMDLGAPKGRLIMPQVKALRDALDADAVPVMCKERELPRALASLVDPPALVITDSQVFPQVAADIPGPIPLTSFSILSARQKGDLSSMVESVFAVKSLKPMDYVLIAESCTHHPLEDDIARVKIPRWLEAYVGGKLQIETRPGCSYPDDLEKYKLVVHCGGCTLTRREMLNRQKTPQSLGIPMTNFGVLISFMKGVFPRALSPFPDLYKKYSSPRGEKKDISLARFTE